MNYKAGDKVVIKPDKLLQDYDDFIGNMLDALNGTDRVVKIEEVISEGYNACFPDGVVYAIGSDAILGYAFEYDEEIVVGSAEGVWHKGRFIAYIPGAASPFAVVRRGSESAFSNGLDFSVSSWPYARPAPKPTAIETKKAKTETIDVTCVINGWVRPLSDISEETLLRIRKASKTKRIKVRKVGD